DVEVGRSVDLEVLHRDAVEAHDRAGQGPIHGADHFLEQGKEGHVRGVYWLVMQLTGASRPGTPQAPPLRNSRVGQVKVAVLLRETVTGELTLLVLLEPPAARRPTLWQPTTR